MSHLITQAKREKTTCLTTIKESFESFIPNEYFLDDVSHV